MKPVFVNSGELTIEIPFVPPSQMEHLPPRCGRLLPPIWAQASVGAPFSSVKTIMVGSSLVHIPSVLSSCVTLPRPSSKQCTIPAKVRRCLYSGPGREALNMSM